VARMGETRNAYRILVGKPEGKRPMGHVEGAYCFNLEGKRLIHQVISKKLRSNFYRTTQNYIPENSTLESAIVLYVSFAECFARAVCIRLIFGKCLV
jgi:hypothetical protein